MKSALWSVAKYLIAGVLLYFILKKVGVEQVAENLKRIPPLTLALAFVLIMLAQIASAMRMRYFFTASGFQMHWRYACMLFFVGSFYNFLLPGGIGGDAYKVILVRKRMQVTAKEGIRIMLADRASGLCVLMLNMFICLMTLNLARMFPHTNLLVMASALVTLAGFIICSRLLLRKNARVMSGSLPYAILVQVFWVAGLITICQAEAVASTDWTAYIVLYCAASIAGLMPITVGGLGVKEIAYSWGAAFMQKHLHSGADADVAVAISLCMFVLMFVTSLPGLLWLNTVEKADFV